MKKLKKVFKYLRHPSFILLKLDNYGIIRLKDANYLKIFYRIHTGQKLNLSNPKKFNEKLQWLKLNERKPEYTKMVDKYEVKKYVANKIGKEHIIPTINVYDNFADIDFNTLPEKFVIKCTHDSGSTYLCKNKKNLNKKELEEKINTCMRKDYYKLGREWPYKDVKPRIIVEKYMVDESGYELKDYKFFCFNGEPKLIQVDFGRFSKHERNIYDTNWNFQNVSIEYPNNPNRIIDKPKKLKEMLEIAKKLSKDMKFVRVDLYLIKDKIYFGEITFYHESGHAKFNPESWNKELGNLIKL